jgi:SAM-dependent methyltransferase
MLEQLLDLVNSPRDMWDLGALPFQVGHQATSSNAPLPDLLPFTVAVDHATGVIVQRPDAGVSRTLARAYRLGSQMGTPLCDHGIGSAQLEDTVSFILEAVGADDLQGMTVLEIGCGRGALLARLAELGACVVGIEPGEPAALAARERGLRVHCEPFTADRFDTARFDLIVHHTVLEHIEQPREFIAEQLRLLSSGGRIVCCVPDCAPALGHGDLSILVHEHWSYFDAHSLRALAASAGAETLTWRHAASEGSIYSAWKAAQGVTHSAPTPQRYFELARGALRAVEEHLLAAASAGATVGVFPGGRFVNYLALAQVRLEALPAIRWFDDDPAAQGRYYPPIAIPIEARDALLAAPVEELLITSWTFGALLREQLAAEPALANTRIHLLADLL